MARILPMLTTITSIAVAAIALPMPTAHAAGPFDGTWVIDAPAAGGAIGAEGEYTCPALRMPFQVKDGQVIGSLRRTTENRIEPGAGPNSAPVSGSVGADGGVSVNWMNFHATGKLAGSTGQVMWSGECGPRTASATKTQ
jgi:hypothetical protein